ncbi:MAG: hypothetical protein KF791_11555 [Verrucomicrobiae bacterium]|nr:hypothetical protein [Verrucomicrobiae bacterium]
MSSVVRRRVLWILLGLAGAAALLVLVALASVDHLARGALVSALRRQTGTGIRLDAVDLGLRDGSIRLRQLVVSNPPGFGPRPLVAIPELYLAYHPEAAASNVLRFREVRLHLSELHVEVDAAGRTNLLDLTSAAAGVRGLGATNWLGGFRFEGVDLLTLTLGRISFSDARDPRRDKVFDLGITNRSLNQVTSVAQLVPLALEIAFKGGLVPGKPAPTSP